MHKLKVNFTPIACDGTEVGYRSSSPLPLTWTLDDGGWLTPHPGLCFLGNKPVPILYEAGWAPGSVRLGAVNLAHTGILSPYRPALRESL